MPFAVIADRYELIRRLGHGGMGDVWLANDNSLGRQVAMKFVGEHELLETPGAEAILRDEARTAGKLLGYPQIVSVLDLFEVDSDFHLGPVLVMEYVDGCNVAEWISRHRGDLDDTTRPLLDFYIALEVVRAIQIAHKRDVIHRDIKPQNILLSTLGLVKVADFGLARFVEALTRSHTVWSRYTALYAAPEQWEDLRPDRTSDVYQLCSTLYHLFAGAPACDATNILGIMRWHQNGTLRPLAEAAPHLGPKLADLISRGLDKDRNERGDLWEIYDELSTSLMCKLSLAIDISGDDFDDALRDRVSNMLDYDRDALQNGESSATFPNPMEALQEALSLKLMGVAPKLTKVDVEGPRPKEQPDQQTTAEAAATPEDPAAEQAPA